MKQTLRIFSVIVTLLCSTVLNAEVQTPNVEIAEPRNGNISVESTVLSSDETEFTVTLKVTPADGYYISKSDITVQKTIDPSLATARAMVPVAGKLELEGNDPDVLSAERTYTFALPVGYNAYVTATFTEATALTEEMIFYQANAQTYTGEALKPIYLKNGDVTLTENTDYTISYEDNVNATGDEPTAKAVITGIGTYKGTLTETFVIFPAKINSVDWTNDPKNPVVKCGSTTLTKDVDYVVNEELRKVSVTGKGNYTTGNVTYERAISAFDGISMSECDFTITPITKILSIGNYEYTWAGTAFTPTVSITYSADDDDIEFIEGTDYTVTILDVNGDTPVEVESITDPGSYVIAVMEVLGSKQTSFSYEVKAPVYKLSECEITVSPLEYSGESFVPTVNVVDKDGNTLEEGVDYEIDGFYIYTDDDSDEVDAVEGAGDYFVSISNLLDSDDNIQVNFTVTAMQQTISFGASQTWKGYCSDKALSLPDGVKAYVITALTATEATATEVGFIPKDVPVLLNRTAEATEYTATLYSGSETVPEGNLLKVDAADKAVNVGEIYVLYNNEFVLASSGTLPAGRVYLEANNAGGLEQGDDENDPARLVIVLSTTAIDNLQLTIDNDQWYTLDGRKLGGKPAARGIYIHNGKKVIK